LLNFIKNQRLKEIWVSMTQEKKRVVHPIIRQALEMAHVGAEPIEFDNEDIRDLKEILSNSFGQPDLFDAVVDLLNFAGLLQQEGSPTASLEIISVVATAADALETLTKKRAESESE
jgi:hypothetical protein